MLGRQIATTSCEDRAQADCHRQRTEAAPGATEPEAMDLPKIEGELAGVHLMHWPILVLGVAMLGLLLMLSVLPLSNAPSARAATGSMI